MRLRYVRNMLESLIVDSSKFTTRRLALILLQCSGEIKISIREEASCDGDTTTNTRTDPACLDARCRTDRQGRRTAPHAIGREYRGASAYQARRGSNAL